VLASFYGYIKSQDGRLICDWQNTGVLMTKGRYRSYQFTYSDGLLLSNPPRNLWKFPRYSHFDMKWLYTTNLFITNMLVITNETRIK
jgi:hypothetical protein